MEPDAFCKAWKKAVGLVCKRRQMLHYILCRASLGALVLVAFLSLYGILTLSDDVQSVRGRTGHVTRHLLSSPDQNRKFTDQPARTISAYVLSVVFGAIATACGIGGGPFFVPLFTYDLGFTVKGAAALSQVVIAAGSLSGVALILHKKSPVNDREPLINYNLVLLMLPALLLGVALGVTGNKALPTWLITMLLLLLLIWLTEKMFVKAFKVHASEKERARWAEKKTREAEQQAADDDEGLDGKKAGPVRKVASEPQGLHNLKDKERNGLHCSEMNGHAAQPGGPLALPPSVAAAMDKIEEGHTEHCEGSFGEAGRVAACPVESPFTAVQGMKGINGQKEEGYHAARASHDASDPEGVSGSSSREQSDQDDVTSLGAFSRRSGGIREPLRRSGSTSGRPSLSLQRMFSRPRPPGAGALGKSASMRVDHVALGPQLSMRRAESVTMGEPRKETARRAARFETFMSKDSLPYFDERPLQEILDEAEGIRLGQEHSKHTQISLWSQALLLLAFWVAFLLLQVLLSLWDFCHPVHWPIYGVLIIVCCAFEGLHIFIIKRAHQDDSSDGAPDAEAQNETSTMQWTLWSLFKLALVTLVCGFIAGLFGIGGGVVLGPLLLSLGTHAKVAAATSNLMVLFSSSAAAIVYGLSGDLNLQISLIFGFSCAVASLVGVFLISRAIDKSGKASIIVFLLSGIIAIGALMTGILGLRQAILDLIHKNHIGFSPLCNSSKS